MQGLGVQWLGLGQLNGGREEDRGSDGIIQALVLRGYGLA